jgi:molybdate transport system regulatory protein
MEQAPRRTPRRRTPTASAGSAQARLWLRVDLGGDHKLGPGKIRLLELIDEHGSISAAGRAMRMSYRRAWLLVESMNESFREPAVATQHGGPSGGGAALTAFGRELVERYRAMERAAAAAVSAHLRALAREHKP